MMKSMFRKSLYDRRFFLLGWGAGVTALALLTVSVFHSFSGDSFTATLQQMPKALQGLIGSVESYTTIDGFINQQIYIKAFPIFLAIFAVIVFSGVLAGEEGNGQLQVLLAQPVSRTKLVLQKFLASLVLCGAICAVVALACLLSVPIIGETPNLLGLVKASFMLWLLICSYGSISFMIGAVKGKRSEAGAGAGAFAFMTYMLSSLAVGVAGLRGIEKISPFHYYGLNGNLLKDSLHLPHIAVLAGIMIVSLAISLLAFNHRDVYQK